MAIYARVSNKFQGKHLGNALVSFVPGVTIKCYPPYVKGVMDSTWVTFRDTPLPKPTDKEGWERKLGMSLLPLMT